MSNILPYVAVGGVFFFWFTLGYAVATWQSARQFKRIAKLAESFRDQAEEALRQRDDAREKMVETISKRAEE